MDPLVASAGITAGANLLGGLLGSSSAKKDRKLAKYQFDQQMDHSVQRRVQDAKKAGIHPLFALGGSVGASPTMQAGGSGSAWADAARNIGDAVGGAVAAKGQQSAQKRAQAQQDMLFDKQMQKVDAEIGSERSLSMLHDAEAAKLRQDLMSTGRDQLPLETAELIDKPKRMPGIDPQVGHLFKMYRDPDTGNYVRLPHPDLNADEILQLQLAGYFTKKEAGKAIDKVIAADRKARVRQLNKGRTRRGTRYKVR